MIYIGENIKRLRREKELTQETLAEFLGVTFQSVSKWERGESYPDITLLPSIAAFFNVSCDELLGSKAAERESEIQKYLDLYSDLRTKDTPYVFGQLSQAIKEFPGEYRLLVSYLDALLMTKSNEDDDSEKILDEVEKIYGNILAYCTDDAIRMTAKRRVCMYYNTLSHKTGKDCYTKKMLDILSGMPNMIDSREYISTLINLPEEEHYTACFEALDREMLLFMFTVSNQLFYKKHFSTQHQIKALEACYSMINTFYDDGNYGSCYRSTVYLLGDLGRLYFANGDTENAVKHLKKCALLAKKHDELAPEAEHSSLFMQGHIYRKTKYGKTLCERMKRRYLTEFDLSDEFKASKEFEQILDIFA